MTASPPPTDGSLRWHAGRTFELALPIIISRAGLIVLFAVDTFAVGQTSSFELAALGVGLAPMSTLMLICLGALQATVVLSAQAIGAGDRAEVGTIFRASVVNALMISLLAGALSLTAESFFRATGQEPALAALAGGVALHFAWGLPALLLFLVCNLVLETIGHPRIGVLIMLGANLVNLLLDGIFVLGWGDLVALGGALAAVATTSAVRWLAGIAALGAIWAIGRREGDRHQLMGTWAQWLTCIATLGGTIGRRIRSMGLPMGLGQGVESAAFATMTLFSGILGPETAAAHQATMTVMSLIYMNSVGTGGATSIRVGNAVGRRRGRDVVLAGWTGIVIGGLLSGFFGLQLLFWHQELATFLVEGGSTAQLTSITMLMAGCLVAFDSMMGVSMGALRGLGDVWIPLLLQSAAFWFVSVPVAWLCALYLGWGAVGLYTGIGAGIFSSLLLLAPRFHIASCKAISGWNS